MSVTIIHSEPGASSFTSHPVDDTIVFANNGAALVGRRVMYMDTIDDLLEVDAADLTQGQQAVISGQTQPGDGSGGIFHWMQSSLESENGNMVLRPQSIDVESPGRWKRFLSGLSADIVAKVPSDFPTLQDACVHFASVQRRGNVIVEIRIESGFNPVSGINLSNGDYSFLKITSEDAEVAVDDAFSGQFILVTNASGPTLACLVDQKNLGLEGYLVNTGQASILPDCGVKNAGWDGLRVRGGHVDAHDTIWTGAINDGIAATHVSNILCPGADVSNAGRDGFFVSRGGILNAQVHDRVTKANNVGRYAVRCHRGIANVQWSQLNDAVERGIDCQRGGIVSAHEAEVTGAGDRTVHCGSGGVVVVHNANLSNSANICLFCSGASRITALQANCSNAAGRLLSCAEASTVNLRQADCRNSVQATQITASTVNLQDADLSGHTPVDVIRLFQGAIVNATGCITNGGAPSVDNFNVANFNEVSGKGIVFVDT